MLVIVLLLSLRDSGSTSRVPHPSTTVSSPLSWQLPPVPPVSGLTLSFANLQALPSASHSPLPSYYLFIPPTSFFFANHMLHPGPPLAAFYPVTGPRPAAPGQSQATADASSASTQAMWWLPLLRLFHPSCTPSPSPVKPFIGALLSAVLLLSSYSTTAGRGFACGEEPVTKMRLKFGYLWTRDIELKELEFFSFYGLIECN